MATVAEKLEEVRHEYLTLYEGEANRETPGNRPRMGFWAGNDDDLGPIVVFAMDALWGEPLRYLDLTPAEARKMASILIRKAESVERIMAEGDDA